MHERDPDKESSADSRDLPSPDSSADAASNAGASRLRILVADDNEDSAETLSMLIGLMGHDVRVAFDGIEAVAIAEEFRPHLAFLDIGMPRLNGYDVARRIREQEWSRNMILAALTGWGQDEDRRTSKQAGFNLHLVKPIDPSAIQKLLTGIQPED
jgi:CheY-like chemotaxis protein